MKRILLLTLGAIWIPLSACRLLPGGSAPPMVTPTAAVSPTAVVSPTVAPPVGSGPSATPAPPEAVATSTATVVATSPPPTNPPPTEAPILAPDVTHLRATGPLALRTVPQESATVARTVPAGAAMRIAGLTADEAWLAVPADENGSAVLWVQPVGIEIVGRLDGLPILPLPSSAEYFPAQGWARSRIRFEPGAVSAMYSGVVRSPNRHSFIFRAAAGQEASITIESNSERHGEPASFQLVGAEDGQPYKRIIFNAPVWESTLPQTQDYYLDVGIPVDSPSTVYTLTLTILPLGQSFDPPVALVEGGTGLLVGGFRDGRWLSPEITAGLLPPEAEFDRYRDQARQDSMVLTHAYGMGGACPVPRMAPLEPNAPFDGLLLANVADPLPRFAVPLAVEDEALSEIVRDYLSGAGLPAAQPRVRQAWQVDLEGDGSAEILLAAHFYANDQALPAVAAGDYALLLLTRETAGGQEVVPLVSELYPEAASLVYPYRYGLSAALDLNGDGVLELIVSADRYEGHRMQVYELDAATGRFAKVMGAGCNL